MIFQLFFRKIIVKNKIEYSALKKLSLFLVFELTKSVFGVYYISDYCNLNTGKDRQKCQNALTSIKS